MSFYPITPDQLDILNAIGIPYTSPRIKIDYSDGTSYQGGFKYSQRLQKHVRHGIGTYINSRGETIIGPHIEDYIHGPTTIIFKTGTIVSTNFDFDEMVNKMVMTSTNGTVYKSQIKTCRPDGIYKIFFPDGIIAIGNLHNGKCHGTTTTIYPSGDRTTHQFDQGTLIETMDTTYYGVVVMYPSPLQPTFRIMLRNGKIILKTNKEDVTAIIEREALSYFRELKRKKPSKRTRLKGKNDSKELILRTQQANLAAMEILSAPSKRSRGIKKRGIRSKKTVTKKKSTPTQPVIIQPLTPPRDPIASSSTPSKELSPLELELQSILPRHSILERVSRWAINDLQVIRTFSDYSKDGMKVQQYKDKTDSQLVKLRARHHFPGMSCIFQSSLLKEKYVSNTNRGFSVRCMLQHYDQTMELGWIYWGIDLITNEIYHCYFEPAVKLEIAPVHIFSTNNLPEGYSLDGWECTRPDFTLVDFEDEECLQATFVGEKHSLIIFPK